MTQRQVIGRQRKVTSQQRRGTLRRKKLIESTRDLMKTHTPQEVSFRAVAARAEMPEGSAYHFFANKYDLFTALAAQLHQEMRDHVGRVLSQPHKNWSAVIKAVGDRLFEYYATHPEARNVILSTAMPLEVQRADREVTRETAEQVADYFERAFGIAATQALVWRLQQGIVLHDSLLVYTLAETGEFSPSTAQDAQSACIGFVAQFLAD